MDEVLEPHFPTGIGQEVPGAVEEDELVEMDWETSPSPKGGPEGILDKNVEEIRKLWSRVHSPATPAAVQPKKKEEEDGKVFIVPDTNIWIGCMDLLKGLLDRKLSNGTRPTLLIPWMVLQELDAGKGTKSNNGKGSQTAIRFIHELLTSKHPRVMGQRATEAASSEDNRFQASNPDDQILLCALQCSSRHPKAIVLFVTNDKNLLNKAMVETAGSEVGGLDNVIVTDAGHLETKLKVGLQSKLKAPRIQRPTLVPRRKGERREKRTEKGVPPVKVSPPKSRKRSHNSGPEHRHSTSKRPAKEPSSSSSTSPQSDTFQSILHLLQDTFSHIIESEMKREYGETWLFALKFKPPWTLQSALKCILAHWIAVFSFVFGQNASVHAQSLLDLVSQLNNSSATKEKEEDVLEVAVSLFTVGKMSKSPALKDNRVVHCRDALLEYSRRNKT